MKEAYKILQIILLSLFVIISFGLQITTAQNESIDELYEQMAEDFSGSEYDLDDLLAPLEEYISTPLEINTAERSDWEKFFFLNDAQIDSFFSYKQKYGSLASVYELQYIYGFDELSISYLLPFIQVRYPSAYKPLELEKVIKYGQHTIMNRTQWVNEHQKGYWMVDDSILEAKENSRYLGSKVKNYLRYSYKYKQNLVMGITAEKDAGEAFGGKYAPLGYDYYSVHFFYKGKNNLKALAIGDFEVKAGQGLVIWTGSGFGKGSATTQTIKRSPVLRKYSSTNENRFLRGAAATYAWQNWNATAFISYNLIDATLNSDTADNAQLEVKSLPEDGYHYTKSSFLSKNTLGLFTTGLHTSYKTDFYKIGTTAVFHSFGQNIADKTQIYNKYKFTGKTMALVGANYETVILHKINIAGELAMGLNNGIASLNTVRWQLAPPLSISLLHRYFTPEYQAMYTSPFSENGEANNEKGFYAGFEFIPIKNWILSGYADIYQFPWSRFRTTGPAQGSELYMKLYYRINRNSNTYIHIKRDNKPENLAEQNENAIASPVEIQKTNIRLHFVSKVNSTITLKNRIEYSIYRKQLVKPEYGILVYQDIAFNLPSVKSVINLRLAMFDAHFNARLYAYESDVLYAMGFPAYFNKGIRWYTTYKYEVSENIDAWFRISQWYYTNMDAVSSGLSESTGSTRTEIKFQVRIKF